MSKQTVTTTCLGAISLPLGFGRDRSAAGLGIGSVQLQLNGSIPNGLGRRVFHAWEEGCLLLVGNYAGLALNVNRPYGRYDGAIIPDAVGHLLSGGLSASFCFRTRVARPTPPESRRPPSTPLQPLPLRRSRHGPANLCQRAVPDGPRSGGHPGQRGVGDDRHFPDHRGVQIGRPWPVEGYLTSPGFPCGMAKVCRWRWGDWTLTDRRVEAGQSC